MNFIIENQIVTRKEIDLDYVENNLCPGQTRNSLGTFISMLLQYSAYHGVPNEPLYQACLRRLNAPYQSTKPEKKKIKEIEAIVRLYEKYKRWRMTNYSKTTCTLLPKWIDTKEKIWDEINKERNVFV